MEKGQMVVWYDGYCNLCSWSVQWIIRNDPGRRFKFAPLQARDEYVPPEPGQPVIPKLPEEEESVVLVMNGRIYLRSAAALRIALRLRFPWPLLGIFFIVPRFLRDPVYRWVARNRKRWFGEREQCFIP